MLAQVSRELEIERYIKQTMPVFYANLRKHDGAGGATFQSDDAYGHSCTVTGGTWGLQGWTADGDDKITLPAAYETATGSLQSGTIIFWVKPTTLTSPAIYAFYTRGGGNVVEPEAFGPHFRAVAGTYYFSFIQAYPNFTLPRGNTVITTNNWYCCSISSDGTQYFMEVNGVVQTITMTLGTNNGNWLGDDIPATPVTYIGMNRYDGADIEPFIGVIGEGFVYSSMRTLVERQHIYQTTKWRYA